MTTEYVKVGNIIKPKRASDGDRPSFSRQNFSRESLLHNAARDGGEAHHVDRVEPSPPTDFERRVLGKWETNNER